MEASQECKCFGRNFTAKLVKLSH